MLIRVAKKLIEYRHRIEYSLIDSQLMPYTQKYQKFVIVCGIRTGSTMLCSLLASHPQTRTFFEVFHRHPGSTPFQVAGYRAKSSDPKISYLRQTDPVSFVNQEVWRRHPERIRAVGFKLLYTQARNTDRWWNGREFDRWWQQVGRPPTLQNAKSDLWSYLRDTPDVYIIHLRRKNLLERVISTKNAQDTGNWGVGATGGVGELHRSNQFSLDFQNCAQDFAAIRRMEDECDDFFSNSTKLNLTYEQLVNQPLTTLEKVQDFLKLRLSPLKTETKKQTKKHISDIVINYSDLREKFLDTQWHSFFQE